MKPEDIRDQISQDAELGRDDTKEETWSSQEIRGAPAVTFSKTMVLQKETSKFVFL